MLLTIIVPIYNMEKYLPYCLDSLEKQNFGEEVEVLLIDDGSTDNSLRLCRSVAKRKSYYRVFHQENNGVAMARNKGLSLARGEYIAWVDPDDYVAENWYAEIKKCINQGNEIVFFDYVSVYEKKQIEFCYGKKSNPISKEEFFEELTRDIRLKSYLWNKIMPRRFYFGMDTFSSKRSFCEDYQALHRVAYSASKIYYLSKTLYFYRQRESSLVHMGGVTELNNMKLVLSLVDERRRFLKDKGIHVSNIGEINTCFSFCNSYQRLANSAEKEEFSVLYHQCMSRLRKNFLPLMIVQFRFWRKNLYLLAVLFGQANSLFELKKKIGWLFGDKHLCS